MNFILPNDKKAGSPQKGKDKIMEDGFHLFAQLMAGADIEFLRPKSGQSAVGKIVSEAGLAYLGTSGSWVVP